MTITRLLIALIARFFPAVLFYKPTQHKVIALTIDDAPTPNDPGELSTQQILDALATHNQQLDTSQTPARATFFIITEHLGENSTIIERIINQGHEIANHGTKDRQTSSLSPQEFENDLKQSHETLIRLSYQPMRWYRPGRGLYNQSMLDILKQFEGYDPRFALASMIPLDTFKLTNHPKFTAWYVSQFIFPGAILVLHSGSLERDKNTAIALKLLLRKIYDQGYKVVTLGNLNNY